MNMTAPRMKPWIEAIHAYVPGRSGGGAGRTVKLSSNENPLGTSPAALAAMRAAADGSNRYPDAASHELRDAIAALHGLEADRVVCGTGSDELLQLLAQAYAGPGDEVLYVHRGFMVYPIAAQRAGATPVAAPDRDYTADVDALLASVTPRTRLVYLANPNNPTGTMIDREEVERLHAGLPDDVLLVLDSAYAEYIDDAAYEDGIAMARKYENVVTTRTFSKIYGLAAARVGWAYGPVEVIAALNRIRGPFNVNSQAQAAAIAALSDQEFVDRCRRDNAEQRARLTDAVQALGNHGLRPIPSAANFVLVEFPPEGALTAERANEFFTGQGILTRWLPSQDLAHALRISVGTEEEIGIVIQALQDFVGQA
ncbi:histidinol-phosphate transaminase [Pacificimonas sp. ICDLI1SI03]